MSRRARWGAEAELILFGLVAIAAPARAQFAGSLTASSSEMFRGETISGADPALSAGVSFDTQSGFFVGASATLALDPNSPRVSAMVQYAGFAKRRGPVTLELGLIHRSYHTIVDTEYQREFFEGFVGAAVGGVRARFYTSPDYLRDGRATYYVEVNAPLLRHDKWQLEGHAGLSLIPYEKETRRSGLRNYRDWRLTLSRPVGPLYLSLGVNGSNYPVYSDTGRGRVFGSVAYAF
jgi:uncharacterized protein (TIGR02001 family)